MFWLVGAKIRFIRNNDKYPNTILPLSVAKILIILNLSHPYFDIFPFFATFALEKGIL